MSEPTGLSFRLLSLHRSLNICQESKGCRGLGSQHLDLHVVPQSPLFLVGTHAPFVPLVFEIRI